MFIRCSPRSVSITLTRAFISTSSIPDPMPTSAIEAANSATTVICPGRAKASAIASVQTGTATRPSAIPARGASSIAATAAEDEHRKISPQVPSSTPSIALVAGTIAA